MSRDMFDMWGTGLPATGSQEVPIGVMEDTAAPFIWGATFPQRAWAPGLYAQTVLAEFGDSGWLGEMTCSPPPSTRKEIGDEIASLIRSSYKRAERAAEILTQSKDASIYWADMLMASPKSHPATWELMTIGNTVAHMVAMHFKLVFKRARPVQVYPALMPVLLTPPHPSYPNAHALESLVMSGCVALAAPVLRDQLELLADRVGYNREVAGVHYPSDRVASAELAPQVMAFLGKGALFLEVVERAKGEWAGLEGSPWVGPKPLPPAPHKGE